MPVCLANAAWTVSYTHLDVYKRQGRLSVESAFGVGSRFQLTLARDDAVKDQITNRHPPYPEG